MTSRIRSALAVIAGIVAGSLVIAAVQYMSPYGPPDDLDINDKNALANWINSLPMSAFALVLLSYLLGSIAAGYVTNLIARGTGYRPALIAGAGLFVAGVMNLVAIPHPVWFAVVSSLLYFVGAWAGGRLVAPQVR